MGVGVLLCQCYLILPQDLHTCPDPILAKTKTILFLRVRKGEVGPYFGVDPPSTSVAYMRQIAFLPPIPQDPAEKLQNAILEQEKRNASGTQTDATPRGSQCTSKTSVAHPWRILGQVPYSGVPYSETGHCSFVALFGCLARGVVNS